MERNRLRKTTTIRSKIMNIRVSRRRSGRKRKLKSNERTTKIGMEKQREVEARPRARDGDGEDENWGERSEEMGREEGEDEGENAGEDQDDEGTKPRKKE